MKMTEDELQNSKTGYPLYLPQSEHAMEKGTFSDQFWQQHSPKAQKVLGNFWKQQKAVAGAATDVNVEKKCLDKNLVKVINGKI